MRLRLPELMEAKGLTAHALAQQSGGRISITSAYRLVANRGALERVSDILEALCDVLGVEPAELFERDASRTKSMPPRPRGRRAKAPATPATPATTSATVTTSATKPAGKSAGKSATKPATKSATKSATKRRP